MVLIVGGISQGKLAFAKQKLGITDFTDGALGAAQCIYNLQDFIRKTEDPREKLERWLEIHPAGVVICNEVGCGVVPIDREERIWRETVGRICCDLASRADEVYRVSCGLGVRIK